VSGGGEPTAVARAARVAPEAHEPARRLVKNPAASRAKKNPRVARRRGRAARDAADRAARDGVAPVTSEDAPPAARQRT
jgi:hypothetical protein